MNVMHKQGTLGFVLRCLPRGAVVLVVCALGAGMAGASSLDTLESFLKTTQSGRADFTQVVTPPTKAGQAVRGKTSTGTVAFMRPSRFRFDYQKPFPMTIVADGQTLWLYDADLAQVTARKQAQTLGSTPAALVATAADLGALQKDFTLSAEPDAENLQWVQATPKARDSALQSVRIGLRLDGGFAALAKLDILDALGQRSVLSFERFEVNPSHQSQAAFSFVPPKGVDVVRP
jgi:outer membrane lipoprotein carrier protein